MKLSELLFEVGGDAQLNKARVETIEKVPGGGILICRVRILDPGIVNVVRTDTWLAKLDPNGEVKCILQPYQLYRFLISRRPTFTIHNAMMFPASQGNVLDAVFREVKVGDVLEVVHFNPAKHSRKHLVATA